jgi:hypothetical protein
MQAASDRVDKKKEAEGVEDGKTARRRAWMRGE